MLENTSGLWGYQPVIWAGQATRLIYLMPDFIDDGYRLVTLLAGGDCGLVVQDSHKAS
jgi:hypothetical protein